MKHKDRERERCILLCLLLGLANNGEVEEEQVQPLGAFSHRNLFWLPNSPNTQEAALCKC